MSLAPLRQRRAALAGLALGVVVVLAVVVVMTLTRGGSEPGDAGGGAAATPATTPATPSPTATSTPLAALDTTALTVQRAAFCDLVDPDALEQTLGGTPADVRTYGNGESAQLAAGVTDIAHEYGCRFRRGRTVARAWVFAPPVTPRDAARLAREARGGEGCDVRREAPAYGDPSVARTCRLGSGSGYEASYRGLFGDAWLACSLAAPGGRQEVLAAAEDWCVAAARAAAQPPA